MRRLISVSVGRSWLSFAQRLEAEGKQTVQLSKVKKDVFQQLQGCLKEQSAVALEL